MVKSEFGLPVVFLCTPGRERWRGFGFELDGIRAIEPLGFLEFLQLEANARLALTDRAGAGGDVYTGRALRDAADNTERPETLEVGANVLAGASAERIIKCAMQMMKAEAGWTNPFGDGRARELILEALYIN
jgi:UDP-N-acetylglucosamine 2-epimerase (non-hydrolysing)